MSTSPEFIAALILVSKTPEKLAAFYRDVLGLPLAKRADDTGAFSCMLGDVHFAVHTARRGQAPTRGAEIGIHLADLDAFVGRLVKKKIDVAPIEEFPWARSSRVVDPDGNTVYLMQLPARTLRTLGRDAR